MIGLALDGGGLFCIAQAYVLGQIAQDTFDAFDFVVGTSGGAINGAAVALGLPREHYVDFYHDSGPKIFAGYNWRRLFRALTSPR